MLEVDLSGTSFADDAFVSLSDLPDLHYLDMGNTQISDASLSHLNLKRLFLRGTMVTDAGLAHLKGVSSLQRLLLTNTRVTDDGVSELQRALPGLDVHPR